MKRPFFFGYGSLVNKQTHTYPGFSTARLKGWRRVWQPSPFRAVSFLNIKPDRHSEISGAIAGVPGGDWAALDERERAYQRHRDEEARVVHEQNGAEIQFYVAKVSSQPTTDHPILLSYLDVVVQGFLAEFGEAGVEGFFATTDGWNAGILDDRAKPAYPRHQKLSTTERRLVDGAISDLATVVK